MYKVKVFSIGKTKERWLSEAIDFYVKRLQGTMTIDWIFAKDDKGLLQLLEKETHIILLDEKGLTLSSKDFSLKLIKSLEESGSRLSLVIGGADGLPATLKDLYPSISLSKLTFTHQIARLILIEQLYRAVQIDSGTPYHKD